MTGPVRYAVVRGGAVTWGPGTLPYRWTTPSGDIIEMHALTEQQRISWGFRVVTQRNWREVDPEIETGDGPIVSVENGLPVETYSYSFTPGARGVMLRKVDEQAEAIRGNHITPGSGQAMEYQEAFNQARAALAAAAASEELVQGQYPFLDADVGVTVNPATGQAANSILEVAQLVAGAFAAWQRMGVAIRTHRLGAKAAIRAAATDMQAFIIYNSAWAGF